LEDTIDTLENFVKKWVEILSIKIPWKIFVQKYGKYRAMVNKQQQLQYQRSNKGQLCSA